MTKLFTGGFPLPYDEMQLAQLFGPFGDIDSITIVRDKFSGKSKGFAFIHMKTAEGAAEAAAALDGYDFGERKLQVRLAEEKTKLKPAPFRRPQQGFNAERKKRPRLSR